MKSSIAYAQACGRSGLVDSRPTKQSRHTMSISIESRPSRRTIDSDCGHVGIDRRGGLRYFSDLAMATTLLLLWWRQFRQSIGVAEDNAKNSRQ